MDLVQALSHSGAAPPGASGVKLRRRAPTRSEKDYRGICCEPAAAFGGPVYKMCACMPTEFTSPVTRRKFLIGSALAAPTLGLVGPREAGAAPAAAAAMPPPAARLATTLQINGEERRLYLDARVTLLDALREQLALTGTKKGCDRGQCGACTVLVDGRRVNACLTLVATLEGRTVTTIEGVAQRGELQPLQAAFLEHDGFQCGYCTPGQICSALAMMSELRADTVSAVTADLRQRAPWPPSDEEIRERMSGNLCRCGAYPFMLAAIRQVLEARAST